MHTLETGLPSEGNSHSGDIVHHVQQHFQFRFQLRHYSLQPYQKPQARQLRQPEQNIQVLPVLIYTFMELRVGISQAAIEQWGYSTGGSGAWALKFNGVYTAVVVGAPGFPAREFCGFTFDYTLTGWSFTAGYNSPISYIRPTTTAISLGY